jgi:peptidoglycan/LPS O-acetylase OafA/YrhL
VLASHYFGVFWTNRDAVGYLTNAPSLPETQVHTPGFATPLLYGIPGFNPGPFGVALFFIISGFVIPFSLTRLSTTGFALGRFFRIWPVYVVGFTITLLAVGLSTNRFGTAWPYPVRDVAVHYVPGLRDLLGTSAIDGIVWTLEIEVKFYLLCLLAAVLFRRRSVWVFAIPALIAVAGPLAGSFWGAAIEAPYLCFMFIGVALHYRHVGALSWPMALSVGAGMYALALLSWRLGPEGATFGPLWLSYVVAIALFLLAALLPPRLQSNRLFEFFADISYPLYVVHAVAGYVALRLLLDSGFSIWNAIIVTVLGAVAAAWTIHALVEVPTHRLGSNLARRFSAPQSSQPVLNAAE